MDSLILQTAIGLVFIFLTFSALVTVLTEGAARMIGLRGEYLLRGIRSLVDGRSDFELPWRDLLRRESDKRVVPPDEKPMVTRIIEQPMVSPSADKGSPPANAGDAKLSVHDRRRLPSYVSGRAFARALIGVLVADVHGQTTIVDIKDKVSDLAADNPIRGPLLSLLTEAGDDVTRFREGVEEWYDDHMARVSGWYKRHVRWISLGIAAVVILLFNVNAVEITRSLYTDEALRGSVVSQAVDSANCDDKDPAVCLTDIQKEIRAVHTSGLPVGWGTASACAATDCNWLERAGLADPDDGVGHDIGFFLLVLVGWALMILAVVPGARFWFDALSRLGSLRSTGPKPASK
jgi:hypothetical protein